LYLWGAGQVGLGLLNALERQGIVARGFIDKREVLAGTRVMGHPVSLPKEVLGHVATVRPFIINTTCQYHAEIAAQCEAAGLCAGDDFLSYDELTPFDYHVIVSGVCNLRCISCPMGNMPRRRAGGLMSAGTYTRVLDKILAENPMVGIIQLYNWGEPLLNPDLASIVTITRKRGVLCAVSSNLSVHVDFEDVIRARPGCFRVSVSGTGSTYAATHTGGNWALVAGNMRRLAALRSLHAPEMPVEVTYHIYQHNAGEPRREVEALCDELGFVFRAHLAALLPLDNVVAWTTGGVLTPQARQAAAMLSLPVKEALALAARLPGDDCSFEHAINIDWNLAVIHCGLYYELDDNVVTENYLETPLDSLLELRSAMSRCGPCKNQALHRFCRVYTDRQTPPDQAEGCCNPAARGVGKE